MTSMFIYRPNRIFVADCSACTLTLFPPTCAMREDLEKRLSEDFPDLYRHKIEPNGWYTFQISSGDGWEPLLRRLSERITQIVQSLPLESPISVDKSPISEDTSPKFTGLLAKGFYADVVKERFGKLRFSMNQSTKEIDMVVHDAQEEGLTTCEMCGRPGKVRDKVWYFVACDEHNMPEEEAMKFSF